MDYFTSLAATQGLPAAIGFFVVALSGLMLMATCYHLLGNVFMEKTEWEVPPEAYRPRSSRELI